jgi:hypothetical protein
MNNTVIGAEMLENCAYEIINLDLVATSLFS